VDQVTEAAEAHYRRREGEMGGEMFHRLERWIILGLEWDGGGFRGINQLWREHLLNMDHLKEGIGLRGYGQRDPLTEYKKEAFDLFEDMFERMKAAVIERLFKVQIVRDAPMELPAMTAWADARESRGEIAGEPARPTPAPRAQAVPRTPTGEKIGRNDPCYCGSGKKYKKCHYLKS
jgi:preprotein translocase subunit SecA